MKETLITILVFAVLFSPFILLLLVLRFVSPESRMKMFRLDIPGWRTLPKATKFYLFIAVLVALPGGGHSIIGFGGALTGSWLWAAVAFLLGMAGGNWEASRRQPLLSNTPLD